MTHHKTEDTMFLLGGALLGAAAMYLLDPKAGQQRRRRIAQAAEGAYDSARQALEEKWDDLASHAKDLTERVSGETTGWRQRAADSAHVLADRAREISHDLSQRAQNQGSHLRQWGGHLWEQARDAAARLAHLGHQAGDDVAHRAHDWSDRVSKRSSQARKQARAWLGHREREQEASAAVMVTSTALTCWTVGMGMMYFLDPNRGHARRSFVYDKTSKLVREAGRSMHRAGKDMANRARGLFYGSRARAEGWLGQSQRLDSEQLVSRCRAELGHYSPQAHQIQIMADADGTVTLTGKIAAVDADGVLNLIHRIPGVTHVIDRLDAGQGEETSGNARGQSMPSSAGAGQ
jgi:gas vesicle protein